MMEVKEISVLVTRIKVHLKHKITSSAFIDLSNNFVLLGVDFLHGIRFYFCFCDLLFLADPKKVY